MPFPGSRVIPNGWSAHHRPVAEGTMTARVRFRDPAQDTKGEFDDSNGKFPTTKATPYLDTACRAQQQKQPQVATTGQQKISTHDYLIAVPIDGTSTVRAGHIGVIYECPDDPTLIGRELRITDVQRGSLMWERDLICTDHLG